MARSRYVVYGCETVDVSLLFLAKLSPFPLPSALCPFGPAYFSGASKSLTPSMKLSLLSNSDCPAQPGHSPHAPFV